ncbi:MAG: lipopolysaccharide biosynthesis protein [Elusimicrobiota bacterium]
MSRSRLFARNVSLSLFGQAGIVVVNFLAVPYLLRGFGSEAYGVYLLMYTVANYLAVFQFGAGQATTKYVAEADAAGEDGALRDALRHSATVHFGGVGVAAAALWLAAGPLANSVFDVPGYYREHAFWLLRAAALGGLFNAGVQWSSASFWGLQRLGWPSGLGLLQSALMSLGLVAVVAMGRGLGAAAVWYVVVQAIGCLLGALALRAAVKGRSGTGGALGFKRFARYGLSFWPAILADTASTQIDKAFVAGLLDMSQLTFYAIPSGVLSRLDALPATISHALMPVLSHAGRIDTPETLRRIYCRTTRALFALSLPALGLLIVLMPQLLGLWLTPAFAHHAEVAARLLVATQAFALAFHAPNALAGGLGGGRYQSAASIGQALLSLALWPVLIPRYGIAGAAAGALAAQALPTVFYLDATHRRLLGLSWPRFLREVVSPLAAPIAALILIAWLGRGYSWTWPGFIATVAAAGAAYAALLWKTLPDEDRGDALRWARG